MEIIKISPRKPDPRVIKKAARVICRGGLVIFPTETVYGLGADAFNPRAVAKIFKVKGRPEGKPLIVHVSKKSTIDVLARGVPLSARKLVRKFWPGPLTLVLRARDRYTEAQPPAVRRLSLQILSRGTVAARMPNHPVALALIRTAGPLAAPSANFSGEKPPTRVSEIPRALLAKVDLVLDAGPTHIKRPSTVLDLTVSPPRILREGVVKKEQLKYFLPLG